MRGGDALVFIFDRITEEVEFNPGWNNGTGYLDGAVHGEHAPVLAPGKVAKFTTNNARRGLMLGTPFGNIVVFERYTNGESGIVVKNIPDEIRCTGFFPAADMNYDQVNKTFGYAGIPNFWECMVRLYRDMQPHM